MIGDYENAEVYEIGFAGGGFGTGVHSGSG